MSFGASFQLDTSSVQQVVGKSNQVVVYGFEHCEYEAVGAFLKRAVEDSIIYEESYPIQKCLNYHSLTTLEGRDFAYAIPSGEKNATTTHQACRRSCKGFLPNLVIENCTRRSEKLEPISLIFCIDVDGNPYPTTPASMLSKDDKLNPLVTHSELRRAYKLCHDPKLDPEVRSVAQNTFKFVKVAAGKGGLHKLELTDAPWKSKDWEAAWAQRKKESKSKPKAEDWRQEMNAHVAVSRLVDDCLAGAVAEVAAEKAKK